MKSWFFLAITAGCMAIGTAAAACPTGSNFGDVPRPRPVQNVSFQASELIDRAARLESAAASREQSARSFEAEAETLANRARILRNQAALVAVADRGSIIDIAEELAVRARTDRQLAAQERAQAAELRIEARSLRDRAVQLVRTGGGGGGGGWRSRPGTPVPPTSTPLPAEKTLTL